MGKIELKTAEEVQMYYNFINTLNKSDILKTDISVSFRTYDKQGNTLKLYIYYF